MKNILSFDLEDWNQLAYRHATGRLREPGSDLHRQLHLLLQILGDHETKATFFVLGTAAEKHPGLIRLVAEQGHEIASHGYAHLAVHQLSRAEFKEDTLKSKLLLEDMVGLPIEGYRAPEFSIRAGSLWALNVLGELGFKYDSSIFPIRHRRYGIPGFCPEIRCYEMEDGAEIIEIPLTSFMFLAARLPVAGGGYFRLIPFSILRLALLETVRRKHPLVTYFHPYEFDKRRLNVFDFGEVVGCREYLRALLFNVHQNLGRSGMPHKLLQLIQFFTFTTCRDYLKEANLHDSRKLFPAAGGPVPFAL